MSAPLLEARGLSVAYGRVEAVRDVSLAVRPGEILAVIGANGAGKSTLLNALMGLLPIAGGRATLDGEDLARLPVEARLERGVCLVPERRELFATLPVADNLALGAFRRGRAEAARSLAAVYDRFPRLAERRRQLAGTLSGGERQMLAMGRALMSRPRLLMLDEPSLGLAPLIVAEILRIVVALRADGVGVLLVEQNARAALAIADRGLVLELGETALAGPAAALAADPRVAAAYLGVGDGGGR